MSKSINEYYSEKMKNLLEMQAQKDSVARLSSPSDKSDGRGYYDDFRNRVAGDRRVRGQAGQKNGTKSGADTKKTADQKNSGQKAERSKVTPEQTARDKREERLREIEAMKNAKRARRFRKIRDTVISVGLICAVFIVMCVVVYRLLFVISDVKAEGSVRYTSDELVRASGVKEGEHLFSFSSKEVGQLIMLRCPEIADVDVERTPPGDIVFNVTEEAPAFYAEFYGEYRMLSPTLRVLGSVTENDAKERGCIKLVIPDIRRANAGLTPDFANVRDDTYIYEVTEAVLNSVLCDRAGTLDLGDKYNMTLTVDGKYILKLGNSESVATKLRIAAAVLEDEMFDRDIKATIDVTDLSETSVVEDQGLVID
ncbi:MAG: FtsQ-type POTRA domain-containing protein [Clostridia bacterium]|nr:FtsQ-type POTRA domain-containing protein [Clostridia bacterium]